MTPKTIAMATATLWTVLHAGQAMAAAAQTPTRDSVLAASGMAVTGYH